MPKITDFYISHTMLGFHWSQENRIFLLISLLHINGVINDNSIKKLFNNLREGKLIRRINTYYSKINNKWYDYDHIYNIYEDIFEDVIYPKSEKAILRLNRINKLRKISGLEPKTFKTALNFEEVLKYLNLYLNKNKNFCIDHLYNEYIKTAIKQSEFSYNYVNNMFNYDFSLLEKNHSRDYEYCCFECSGDYDSWYDYKNNRMVKSVKEDIVELVSEFLNTKRTKYKGSYKKFVI